MLCLIWQAALLLFAFTTASAADATIDYSRTVGDPDELFDFSEDEGDVHNKRESEVKHYNGLQKHHHHHHHHGNHQAEHHHHSTEWHRKSYSNNGYIDKCLRHHNYHRRVHGAYDMKWDPSIAHVAQEIARSCVYAHNQQADPQAGQNIAAGVPPANVSGVISDLWYNREEPYFRHNYGIPQPSYQDFNQWGHMTQMVWKGTTHFGCATQYCPQGLANTGGYIPPYFTVCNYKSAGNYPGEYARNIGRPQRARTVHWYHKHKHN